MCSLTYRSLNVKFYRRNHKMRNFKKFLALVLAMLMVSACAVSVSAVYADQDAVNATGYAEAVDVLGTLGVMQGSGDGNFNPNGTLTRAEAAVIAAKLDAGAAGKSYDWTAATTAFADVDAAWSFAYINYVSQRGIMDGVGNGNFNPNGTLSVAQALTIAVKAAGLQSEVAALAEISTPAYWATHWISVASKHNFDANVNVWDYDAACSRATMAQIAYNILMNVESIKAGFGLVSVSAEVQTVTDVVTLSTGHKINLAAFNAALAASGATETAADLKGCIVTLTYSSVSNEVYGISVDTDVATATYADAVIANVYDSNKVLTNNITIAGVTYTVNATDSSDTSIIGGTTSSKGIAVTVDGEAWETAQVLPTYYKAYGYDDDADGDFDRLVLNTYSIQTAKVVETNDKGVVIYALSNGFTNDLAADADEKAVVWTGEALVTDNETPMLVANVIALNDAGTAYVADVLEIGAVVSGKLVGIGADYVNIDGTKYSFVSGAVTPENWTLNQTVSVYTIGGKYVKVTSASKSDIEVVVNSAVVTDGKAVITGYNKSAGYADITVTVEGLLSNGKLASRAAKQYTNKDADGKEYNTTVAVGYVNSSDAWVEEYELTEGAVVALRQTEAGAYITGINGSVDTIGTDATAGKLEIKNGYIYTAASADADLVATGYAASDIVILEKVVDSNAKADTYAAVSYNKLSSFAARANVSYDVVLNSDNKATFVYVDSSAPVTTITKTTALAEGQSIVYVKDATVVEATYDKFLYNAIDLMSGTKVQITHTGALESGEYYIVKDGAVVEHTTDKWIGDYVVTVEYTGLIGVVKAQAIVKSYNSATEVTSYAQEGDVLSFGLDNITIYNAGVLDADGNVSKANINDTLMTGETHTVNGDVYVVAGQMIIVLK